MNVRIARGVMAALGESVHRACFSNLRELSLSKCSIEKEGWALLLGRGVNQQYQSMSEVTDEDMMNVSESAVTMSMQLDEESSSDLSDADRKPPANTVMSQAISPFSSFNPSSPLSTVSLCLSHIIHTGYTHQTLLQQSVFRNSLHLVSSSAHDNCFNVYLA